jgi:hypothetical protein
MVGALGHMEQVAQRAPKVKEIPLTERVSRQ